MLHTFVTGIGWGDDHRRQSLMPWLGRLLPATRRVEGVPGDKIYRIPLPEIRALTRLRVSSLNPEEIFSQRNLKFQEKVPQRFIEEAAATIGFDTSSLLLAERVQKAGKPFIMDASIAHPLSKEKIYAGLAVKYPGWAEQVAPKAAQLIRMEQREMEMAGRIVVASTFTKNTYLENGVPQEKIRLNPYGTDLHYFKSKWADGQTRDPQSPVKFAFMGKISARKGIPWLLEVWKDIRRSHSAAELVIAGNGEFPDNFNLPPGVALQAFIDPAKRLEFLHNADVLLFPSFFEGFGQVIVEAMAAGLPVITTTHTAGPELLENGKQGFVIAPGDSTALAAAMQHFLNNPSTIEAMGKAAATQALGYTWDAYGDRWAMIIEELTRQHN